MPVLVFKKVVILTNHSSLFTRYTYSLFWGFQQITTLTGNQVPNYNFVEVFFTMMIIGLGLLLFPRLIGNMQNFFQAGTRRNSETLPLTPLDLEQLIHNRQSREGGWDWLSGSSGLLPEDLTKICYLRICLMTFKGT